MKNSESLKKNRTLNSFTDRRNIKCKSASGDVRAEKSAYGESSGNISK